MLNYLGDCLSRTFLGRTNTVLSLMVTLSLGVMANQASGQIMDSPADTAQRQINEQVEKAKLEPYQMSSRIYLGQGTQTGYLVVEVQLAEGKHIYSLTQGGVVPPTILKVLPNNQIQLTGDFSPDTPATVIEKDPDFKQRLEKHLGKVQFFAPIKVTPTADLAKLAAEIQFDGQICSQDACVPIRAKKIASKFAGYFDSPPAAVSTAQQPAAPQQNAGGVQLK